MSLSVASFVDIMDNSKEHSFLLMEFSETFNACLSHHFSADDHFMVMMMILTVKFIWFGTILLSGQTVDSSSLMLYLI